MKFYNAISFSVSLFLSLAAINYSILHNREGFLFSASLAALCLLRGLIDND